MASRVLRLPALREDLQLIAGSDAGPDNARGEQGWLIYDPLRHRYFQILAATFRLLARWQTGMDSRRFMAQAQADNIPIDEQRFMSLLEFLRHNQLLQVRDQSTRDALWKAGGRARQGWLTWLIHHYLFIRIPLFRPERFLQRTSGFASLFFKPAVSWMIRLMGLIGIMLVVRQWQTFVDTFSYFFNWQGLLFYLLALVLIKSAHELGHAYTAHRYGCRVTSIGVAFLVLLPVLYTDTTDAWRLRDHRQRLRIAMAGIRVELHIALLATFLWTLLPDGGAKSAAFFIATTSWLTSLAVNLSPFMRFDGYFMLVDLLRADNLQPRAFALARWQLRQWLFGLDEAAPERLPLKRHWTFVIYAWLTWIYRFFLFLGIALLVYHFAFKLLGIALFVVEIAWFILLPVGREISLWWSKRDMIKMNRQLLTSSVLLLILIGLLLVPWRQQVSAPAIMSSEGYTRLYVPEAAKVAAIEVNEGEMVQAGQRLLKLENPGLQRDLALVERKLQLAGDSLALARASKAGAGEIDVLSRQLSEWQAEYNGLLERRNKLQVTAPIAGQVTGMQMLAPGQWVNRENSLLGLNPQTQVMVTAYIEETLIHRLQAGNRAVWIGDFGRKIPLEISHFDYTAGRHLEYPELSSLEGGDIPVRQSDSQMLKTEQAFYKTFLKPVNNKNITIGQRQRGIVHLESERKSIASSIFDRVSAIVIRESGF
jgi:putative peptide zinc metalloprotease protein